MATNVTVVGRAYRQARCSGVDRVEAERVALNAYCSLNPDSPDREARAFIASIAKAFSEAGLIWIET